MMDADIGGARLDRVAMHMRQSRGDAVEERLTADKAMIGQHVGAEGHMLAAPETDFEMERAIIAEQSLRRYGAIGRHRYLGEQIVHQ